MTNWTACQSLRDIIITSVGRKRSMLISSMMSLDHENAKTGQCTNAAGAWVCSMQLTSLFVLPTKHRIIFRQSSPPFHKRDCTVEEGFAGPRGNHNGCFLLLLAMYIAAPSFFHTYRQTVRTSRSCG